ncbi:MAG TPA: ATP-binding protein [Bacteroidales bacterium]|nr:ATP-binding protein [Bacteroidales bacterium]HPT20946.1 ATP-binding protein [Bacteroidales bacterium]
MITLSLNILDIVQNSIRAKADEISIEITESVSGNSYRIIITDNGTGIPPDILANVTDPFVTTRTKRKMGLGLSLLKYHAELAGGGLKIDSEPGKGTKVTADFILNHIDRQPLGDIVGTIIILVASNPEINFIYQHSTDKDEYRFSSKETKEFLEVETLYDKNLLDDIASMISENLKEIEASGITFKEK